MSNAGRPADRNMPENAFAFRIPARQKSASAAPFGNLQSPGIIPTLSELC